MEKQKRGDSRHTSVWAMVFCLALCGGLILSVLKISIGPARAAVINVQPISDYEGQYGPNQDTVYQVYLEQEWLTGSISTGNWTIESIVQEGNSYQDANGNFYILPWVDATMTVHCDKWVINNDPYERPMIANLPDQSLNNFSLNWSDTPGTTITCTIPSCEPGVLLSVKPYAQGAEVVQTSPKDNLVVCAPDIGYFTQVLDYDGRPYFDNVLGSTISVNGAGVTATDLTYVRGMYGANGVVYDGDGEFYAAADSLIIRAPAGKIISEVSVNGDRWPAGAREFTFDNSSRNLGYPDPDMAPPEPEIADMELTIADDPNGGGEEVLPDIPPERPDTEPEPPPVRVENNVNVPGLSSDTVLWPLGTYKDGYISYTTITDRELDALIAMANDHSGDAEGMEGDGYKEGIIYVDKKQSYHDKEAMTYRVTFTEKQFNKLAEVDWDRLTVLTPIGRFSIYEDAIRQTAETGSGDVAFRLQKIDHDGRPGLDVSLQVDREHITQFNKPYGTRIFIPYELQEGEDPNAIIMEYIHSDGTKEIVTECHYDAEAGGVYFFSSHLSKFGVSYRPAAFKDVGPKHWANPYVTFLASRGVINGGGGGTFRPDDPATRAEFIHVLASSLSSAQLPKRPIQVYSDVSTGHFAARAADWVYFNNLDGAMTRGGSFYPSEAITRQDAATLVNNAANGSNLRIRSKGKDSEFNDLASVADYARQSVQRLAKADILKMNDSHKFFPTKAMNRGEMAQIIATLLSSL